MWRRNYLTSWVLVILSHTFPELNQQRVSVTPKWIDLCANSKQGIKTFFLLLLTIIFEPITFMAIFIFALYSSVMFTFLGDMNMISGLANCWFDHSVWKKSNSSSVRETGKIDAKRQWHRTSKTLKWSHSKPGLKSSLNENGPLRARYWSILINGIIPCQR